MNYRCYLNYLFVFALFNIIEITWKNYFLPFPLPIVSILLFFGVNACVSCTCGTSEVEHLGCRSTEGTCQESNHKSLKFQSLLSINLREGSTQRTDLQSIRRSPVKLLSWSYSHFKQWACLVQETSQKPNKTWIWGYRMGFRIYI